MPRDTSDFPLPPAMDPPQGDHQALLNAQPLYASGGVPQTSPDAGYMPPGQLGPVPVINPFPHLNLQPEQAPPAAPPAPPAADPAAPEKFLLKTPSGIEVETTHEEVARRFADYEQQAALAQQAQAIREWAAANPDRAEVMARLIRGEEIIPAAAAPSQGGQEGLDLDAPPAGHPASDRQAAEIQRLRAELAQAQATSTRAAQRSQTEILSEQIDQALNEVPFAKNADPAMKKAIGELAAIDVARYGSQGVKPADAVRNRANEFERAYQAKLNKAVPQVRVPTPQRSGADSAPPNRSVPNQRVAVPTRPEGLGFAEWLASNQRDAARSTQIP
jgi:hypothetical protein